MPIAMVFAAYGPPEVLQPMEVARAQPGPGQVRIKVMAAGVQPFDCAMRRGDFARWMTVELPSGLGHEFAGVIEAVGEGTAGWAIGDEVLGWVPMAGYSESVLVSSDQMVAKPPSMPWREAGVLSASGQTAHTALQDLRVGRGDTLLIHAAAGGVGSFAVQIARAAGAAVIGTASERNHDYLRHLGAIPVAYGEGLEARVRAVAPAGITVALDLVGGEALPVSLKLVSDRERIGTTADRTTAARFGVRVIGTVRSTIRLTELTKLYVQGRLRIVVSQSFPLREVAAAHRVIESGHVRGKVALLMADAG